MKETWIKTLQSVETDTEFIDPNANMGVEKLMLGITLIIPSVQVKSITFFNSDRKAGQHGWKEEQSYVHSNPGGKKLLEAVKYMRLRWKFFFQSPSSSF